MKIVFLDRDGVINKDYPDYVVDWAKFEFLPGSLEALKLLTKNDYRVIVITNQSGVGKGIFTAGEVEKLHEEMKEVISYCGGHIEKIYYCPHHPDDNCDCRKPKPGMIQQAAIDYGIDLAETCMVGDWVGDMGCGKAAGCGGLVLVKRSSRSDEALNLCKEKNIDLDYVAESLLDVVKWITGIFTC